MDFLAIAEDLKRKGQAGRRFEREGHGRFRDCLTVCRSGRFLFERFCYGEAAGLVCLVWGAGLGPDGAIDWEACPQSEAGELPLRLTAALPDGALEMDGQKKLWRATGDRKKVPGESGGLFGRLAQKWKKQ